jgi:Flp pilus assembly protein TadG
MNLPKLSGNDIFKQIATTEAQSLPRNLRSDKVNLERVYGMCRRKRRGAAAVEFAIVAPLFFMLILGMVEVGRLVMVQQIITNASREGARIAILDGTTHQNVLDKVNTYLASAKIKGATTTTDPSEPSTAGYGQPVTVTVSIPASQISWVPRPRFAGGGKILQASTVMRRETVQ